MENSFANLRAKRSTSVAARECSRQSRLKGGELEWQGKERSKFSRRGGRFWATTFGWGEKAGWFWGGEGVRGPAPPPQRGEEGKASAFRGCPTAACSGQQR